MLSAFRLPWPTRWEEYFNRNAILLMEIGFGGGHFLVDLARNRPEANILGVEISAPSLRRAERKIKHAGLTNVLLLDGSAQLVLQANCAPTSLDEIYLNFPDPWPKPSHLHRRLIDDRFLLLLATRMGAGGLLEIATDDKDYAYNIAWCLEQSPFFESRVSVPYITKDDQRLRTKYELTAIKEGRTCYYVKWQRNRIPTPADLFPIPEELSMPHVVLYSPLNLSEIGKRFKPMQVTEDTIRINFMDCFQSLAEGRLLIEAYVNEPPMNQRVGLIVRARGSGELVASLSEIGFPRSTVGIQLAIRHLSNWLAGLDPRGRWIRSNLKQQNS